MFSTTHPTSDLFLESNGPLAVPPLAEAACVPPLSPLVLPRIFPPSSSPPPMSSFSDARNCQIPPPLSDLLLEFNGHLVALPPEVAVGAP